MATSVIETLIADYLAAWSETDAINRQQILARIWADEGRYTDPQSDGQG
jgi:hypothetical protein